MSDICTVKHCRRTASILYKGKWICDKHWEKKCKKDEDRGQEKIRLMGLEKRGGKPPSVEKEIYICLDREGTDWEKIVEKKT